MKEDKKNRVKKMLAMRKRGMLLSEIGDIFGVTKQYVFFCLGPTTYLVNKKFEYKCKYCGKKFGYVARKERRGVHKFCSTPCSGMGRRTLDIPFERNTKEYEKMKSAIYYSRNRKKRNAISMKSYWKNRDKRVIKMREYYKKIKLKKYGE